MLRVVHPGDGGNKPSDRRKGARGPSLSLTPDEARHLRATVRNIARTRFGSVKLFAAALGVNRSVLSRRPTAALAVAVWRLTGTPLEELLRPKLAAVPPSSGPTLAGAS